MCGGDGQYKHQPSPMLFERKGFGVHHRGAIFSCTICRGRKFVEDGLFGKIDWEWKDRPQC